MLGEPKERDIFESSLRGDALDMGDEGKEVLSMYTTLDFRTT